MKEHRWTAERQRPFLDYLAETGIVVAGRDGQGRGWVLADVSGRYQPAQWARAEVAAYKAHGADRIVAETNNGAELLAATLRSVDPTVPFAAVHASRGKITRAEPIATLYGTCADIAGCQVSGNVDPC